MFQTMSLSMVNGEWWMVNGVYMTNFKDEWLQIERLCLDYQKEFRQPFCLQQKNAIALWT